ncbi:MAG: GntR family transcriptional regulator [Atribacterota bacterium]
MITRDNLVSQAKKEIMNLIFRKGFSKGERFFSIEELSELLSVSKTTIREAIRSLEQLHFVEVKQGKGIYLAVDPKSLGKNIAQLRSATEMARESGIDLKTLSWEIQEVGADSFLAEKLGVRREAPLVLFTRVRGFDDEVVLYLEDILPKELVADFTPLDWQGSLFEALERRGIFVSHSIAKIIPYIPEGKIKAKLRLPETVPFLLLEHLHFDVHGRVVAFSKDYYNSKYFHFEVVRKRI